MLLQPIVVYGTTVHQLKTLKHRVEPEGKATGTVLNRCGDEILVNPGGERLHRREGHRLRLLTDGGRQRHNVESVSILGETMHLCGKAPSFRNRTHLSDGDLVDDCKPMHDQPKR